MKILKINEFLNNKATDIQSTAFVMNDGDDFYTLVDEKQFVKEYNEAIANNTAEAYYNKYVKDCYNDCDFTIDEEAFDFENPIRVMEVINPENDQNISSMTVSKDFWNYEIIKRELWMTDKYCRWTSQFIDDCGSDLDKLQVAIINDDEDDIETYRENYKQDLLDFEITDDENPQKVIFKFTDEEISKLISQVNNDRNAFVEPFDLVKDRLL